MSRLAIHDSLQTIVGGLQFPRQECSSLKSSLAFQLVNLSVVVRDFTLDFTYSHFQPDRVPILRNLIQGVIRPISAIESDTQLFDDLPIDNDAVSAVSIVRRRLSEPTRLLLAAMVKCVQSTDVAILRMAGLEPDFRALDEAPALKDILPALIKAEQHFDAADALLVNHEDVSAAYEDTAVVKLFLFVHSVRQTADKTEALVNHVIKMQQDSKGWRIQAPSYPCKKAIMRTNAQVRHDRGGLTAASYFRAKNQLNSTMAELQSRPFVLTVRNQREGQGTLHMSDHGEHGTGEKTANQTFRYKLWEVFHRLQGFESRFAFKVTLVTTLLSIPAWLSQSRAWWIANESWWTVVTVWLMMHPRVGGTMQDLVVRCFCAVIGATWSGLAYRAGNGNPYIMGVFAAIFLIPMLYRFTQSPHPRSGLIGCITFTVVSLDTYTSKGLPSTTGIAWTRGMAFVVGTISAVVVNWILWPFVARHELRKSLSAMMLHSAILYRGVIAKYIYHAQDEEPGSMDREKSELLEGRLREGFVRMRQLLELTRHETVSLLVPNVRN